MRRTIVAAALVIGAMAGAEAQDAVPDFTGKWSGDFDVITLGRDAGAEGKVIKANVTYDLAHQDGRVIWGTVSSDKTEARPIVLSFSFNNGTLIGSDTMGFHRITIISPTRLESCFTDNGSGAIVSSCGIIERNQ